MIIRKAEFQCSSEKIGQCPKTDLKEFAFIGRSNVGKSSLINMLTNNKSLAKVSGTPGKTKLINHFKINDEWYLVDLPGYGFARTSKKIREEFSKLIINYITKYENLYFLFVLVDSRLEPQKKDLEFIDLLGENQIPFAIIFTKADKLSQNKIDSNLAQYRKVLKASWEQLPDMLVTSSEKKTGKDVVLDYIDELLKL
ncbi:MAG: ribosome biogenesis GTP-binding protein YihA/YsxC [Rikenellaceae bacterium]